jgi:signal transduction histidine kinase
MPDEAAPTAQCEVGATAERLQAIANITDAALGYSTLDDSLRELVSRSCVALFADFAALLILADGGKHFVVRAAQGLTSDSTNSSHSIRLHGIAGSVAEQHEPRNIEEIPHEDDLQILFQNKVRSLMGAPLRTDSAAIGIILVGTFHPRQITEVDLWLLQVVAHRAVSLIEHARLLEQIRAGRERAQVLSQQLMEAQEAERRHLARELHDEIGQALTAVKINLQAVQRALGESAAQPRLEESVTIVDRALQQVRNLSLDLRPSLLDDLGLVAALRWYVDRLAQRTGFVAEFVADPPGIRAPANLETACFRVAQEALTNVVRHARAHHVRVELLQHDTELHLLVRDDGIGFEVAAARQRAARGGSLGLLGMQERVLLIRGRIDIQSVPGQGTEIRIRLPLTSALERRSKRRDT